MKYQNIITDQEETQLKNAIQRIMENDVSSKKLLAKIPLQDELLDSNMIVEGKCTMMFVDIRDSTNLPQLYEKEQLVKIYRTYTRVVIQGVRYSGGFVRDFMGDGILSLFIDDENGRSEAKAIRAARYITTVIDKILNPILDKTINNFRISCGIGISTDEVMITKVGMKGRESDLDSEDEYGIAWIGNCTNIASKLSNIVSNGSILIDLGTYSAIEQIEQIEQIEKWKYTEKIKGKNIFRGYIAKNYYLTMVNECEPLSAEKDEFHDLEQTFFDDLKDIFERKLCIINEKSEEIGVQNEKNRKNELENRTFLEKLKQEKVILRFYVSTL